MQDFVYGVFVAVASTAATLALTLAAVIAVAIHRTWHDAPSRPSMEPQLHQRAA